jgi:hypothetical protein
MVQNYQFKVGKFGQAHQPHEGSDFGLLTSGRIRVKATFREGDFSGLGAMKAGAALNTGSPIVKSTIYA